MIERRVHPRGGMALGMDTLQYSLQFLMTRFARSRDPQVARVIVEHLEMLLGHPAVREYENGFRELYSQLLDQWRGLAAPAKGPLLPPHTPDRGSGPEPARETR